MIFAVFAFFSAIFPTTSNVFGRDWQSWNERRTLRFSWKMPKKSYFWCIKLVPALSFSGNLWCFSVQLSFSFFYAVWATTKRWFLRYCSKVWRCLSKKSVLTFQIRLKFSWFRDPRVSQNPGISDFNINCWQCVQTNNTRESTDVVATGKFWGSLICLKYVFDAIKSARITTTAVSAPFLSSCSPYQPFCY